MKNVSTVMKKMVLRNFPGQFNEIIQLIEQARHAALKSVNKELISLYWQIGRYISEKIKSSEWGESVVEQLADYIQKKHPELRGYTWRGLYRMRQFFETYHKNKKLSPLVTQISWTNNLIILSKTKSIEEKEFYILLSIKENYSKRANG